MKNVILLALSMLCTSAATATEYPATGTVNKIFAMDKVLSGADQSHILITGFTAAGSCLTNDGLIALALRDDEGGRKQMAVALAAKLAGAPLSIRTDDSAKNATGMCYLKYLELN